jgi:hypothetical protein
MARKLSLFIRGIFDPDKIHINLFYLGLYVSTALFGLFFILRTSFMVDGKIIFTLVEDAMISMRYAKHLAEGYGIVWNIGEAPIEGYTNFLWMLYMSLLHLIFDTPSFISLIIMLSGLVLILANIHVVRKIAEYLCQDVWIVAAISALFAGFYFPTFYWTLRGTELGVIILSINLATLLAIRSTERFSWQRTVIFSALLIISNCIRLDASVSLVAPMSYMGYYAYKRKKLNHILVIVLSFIVSLVSLYLFRLYYFGEGLPNTYYLKVTGVPAVERILVGIKVFLDISLDDIYIPFFLAAGGMIWYRRLLSPKSILLMTIFLLQCAYSIYVGGDYAEYDVRGANRFISIGVLPLFIIAAATIYFLLNSIVTHNIITNVNRKSVFLVVTLGITALSFSSGSEWKQWVAQNAPMLTTDIWRARLGFIIKQSTLKDAVIAGHGAGQIPYYSERTSIDLLGKNDRIIASSKPVNVYFRPGHNKWDYTYSILQRKPDVVADEWGQLKFFLQSNRSEYMRLQNGVWVKRTSKLIDQKGLERIYIYRRQGYIKSLR